MKLRCDGQSPCGSCVKRNLDCNNERISRPLNMFDEGMALHVLSYVAK